MLSPQTTPVVSLGAPQSIRLYFERVRELAQTGEEYPVKLEEVWPLVYSMKNKAVRSLRQTFLEGIDFQVLTRIGQNPNGGRPEEDYRLTVACMEFFIARKVREVFEVYRKVFHHVVQSAVQAKDNTGLMVQALTEVVSQQSAQIAEQSAEIATLSKIIANVKREYTRAYKAKVVDYQKRQETKKQEAYEVERDEWRKSWFKMFENYIQVDRYADPKDIMDMIFVKLWEQYKVNINAYPQRTGEHRLDVAYRIGAKQMVNEILAHQLPKSNMFK